MIRIIDLFAGPGGLGEGFSSLFEGNGERTFNIKLSIEKDRNAYETLKLRSFFRQFPINEVPEDYYSFVRGDLTREQLYANYRNEADNAAAEAWCGTLGDPEEGDENALTNEEIDDRITGVLEGHENWVLIGGPPCQAYSIVGRARRKEKKLDETKDKRVGLYKEYLRIIAVHKPAVFVMENVKGLLSAETNRENIFSKILADLSDPIAACNLPVEEGENTPKYRIFSLTVNPDHYDEDQNPVYEPMDYLIESEKYGIPQKRHRVILLGVRDDLEETGEVLQVRPGVTLRSVIGDLPKLRSGLSREFSHSEEIETENNTTKKKRIYKKLDDSTALWKSYVISYNKVIDQCLGDTLKLIKSNLPDSLGENFIPSNFYYIERDHPLFRWYTDPRLGGILHHESRKHMVQDIKRYLFAARYVEEVGDSPKLEDYKKAGEDLLPDHENAESGKFTDRFRVQLPDSPATTVTSHIAKDGHYFIHYDPKQARSLTVREAARIQTFPDNYYFCGGRTEKFHQVGNAVPPFLASQIGVIVRNIFDHNGLL